MMLGKLIPLPDTSFLCVGDWNLEPDHNPFSSTADFFSRENPGSTAWWAFSPTCWGANRCIDYAVTNLRFSTASVSILDVKYADYKPLKFSCDIQVFLLWPMAAMGSWNALVTIRSRMTSMSLFGFTWPHGKKLEIVRQRLSEKPKRS